VLHPGLEAVVNPIRHFHRFFRALLFVGLMWGLIVIWRAAVDPRLLDLATFGEFVSIFVLIAVAGIVTHRVGRWIAPAEKGDLDEDSDEVEPTP
jgi:heme A synthase